jgi:antitoxin VapB
MEQVMAFHIRDAETDRLVRELAAAEGLGLTEAVKLAVRDKLEARKVEPSLWEKLQPLLDRVACYPKTGLEADKAFYDSLNDE